MTPKLWNPYWFEFPVLRRRMVLWRVLFFGLLCADFWLILLEHAPRFGAGGFNVAQWPFLDALLPVPTPDVVGPLYLLGGFLSLAIALGVAPRRCLFLLAPVYAGVYFWSQSDSYQHHYFISLLLLLLTLVPDEAWTLPRPGEPTHVRSWAMRLVYVQIGLMYAWTAVTKHTGVWMDGTTLEQILTCEPREQLRGLAAAAGWPFKSLLALAATSVMIGEYIAGVAYLARPLWVIGLFLIPAFHVGVEWLGLDIELFSYYMIGTNLVLLMPERWCLRLTDALARLLRPLSGLHRRWAAPRDVPPGTARLLALGVAGLVFLLGTQVPYAGAWRAGAALAFGGLFLLWPWSGAPTRTYAHALALVLAGLALSAAAHFSETAYNYYRQWGGHLRRQGDDAGAREMYARANAAAGGTRPARHLPLARLVAAQGDTAGAVSLVEEDLRRQRAALGAAMPKPDDADAWFERGRTARALAEALAYATQLYPAVGREADVEALRAERTDALRVAREAFQKNVEISPACGQGRTELARLAGGRNTENAGEP